MNLQPYIEEQAKFLVRVYGDLTAADGFVGITPEQVMYIKAKEALTVFGSKVWEELVKEIPEKLTVYSPGSDGDKGFISIGDIKQTLLSSLESELKGKV